MASSCKTGLGLALLALCCLSTCHAFNLKDVSALFHQGTAPSAASEPLKDLSAGFERPVWWNETVMDVHADKHIGRRSMLGMGDASPVSVTFYSEPNMDCETGNGQCGYGSDASGDTDFMRKALYPLHVAAGNMEFLGGCGACGILTGPTGFRRGYVVTDVTEVQDDLGPREWPPVGCHIDMCCSEFHKFQSLDHGSGMDCNNGGIFTGSWQRVACESLGSPNYPDNKVVIRVQAWNQYAKAVVPSRLPGTGEVAQVNFITEHSGFHTGRKVDGWGAWWTPNTDLSGHGGVALQIIMRDGRQLDMTKRENKFPMGDFATWQTGQLYDRVQWD